MTILAHPLHTFKTGDTFVGATVEGGNLVLGETRNEEAAHEGRFPSLLTVIPLVEAIKMAKAILAAQQQPLTEDAKFDAWIDEHYQHWLDHKALVDSALEHEVAF